MQFPDLVDSAEWGFLALRVVIGVIFIVHGLPKITGAKGMVEAMTGAPNPAMAALFTILGVVEVVGGTLLALGVLTQIVVIPLMIVMLGAITVKNTQMKTGFTSHETTGWELDLLILTGLLLLFLAGPGELAIQT